MKIPESCLWPRDAGGDVRWSGTLLGGDSIVFDVPLSFLKPGIELQLPSDYAWDEKSSYKGSPGLKTKNVAHYLLFDPDFLPEKLFKKAQASR